MIDGSFVYVYNLMLEEMLLEVHYKKLPVPLPFASNPTFALVPVPMPRPPQGAYDFKATWASRTYSDVVLIPGGVGDLMFLVTTGHRYLFHRDGTPIDQPTDTNLTAE